MTILITTEQIIAILVGLCTLIGIAYGVLYVKLKDLWRKDIEEYLDRSCSEIVCSHRTSTVVNNKFELVSRDLDQLKSSLKDLKLILNNQQETLLAIQLSVTEFKPKLESLERRVTKIEDKIE